ncbi:MAG: NFACT RNA binding domain-containing protein [Eubacteriales bacterium]|nr:NFACT RNA binding domain-containing protein [Eubacteriales bacterium]
MAFDALTVSALTAEIGPRLTGGRITKINQPEHDEIVLTVRTDTGNERLVLSANASIPLFYIDNEAGKPNPKQAPDFCMVLRKHLQNGRILAFRQVNRDRLLEITVSHYDEMGDLAENRLIAELMGKHANIILVNPAGDIVDSIKRINHGISAKREVLPGRPYFRVAIDEKLDITTAEPADLETVFSGSRSVRKILIAEFRGISPRIAEELCYRCGIDSNLPVSVLRSSQIKALTTGLHDLMRAVDAGQFSPAIYYDGDRPVDFAVIEMTTFEDLRKVAYERVSDLLRQFYDEKQRHHRMMERTVDLRNILNNHLDRLGKKLDIWTNQMRDCAGKDRFQRNGELILAYSWQIQDGDTELVCADYHEENRERRIKLDPHKTPSENANHYYARYNKMKRTEAATRELLTAGEEELLYLQSVAAGLAAAESDDDLIQIRAELAENGYMKRRHSQGKKVLEKSPPLHFEDEDGYHYYAGKNNYQNEFVSFRLAENNDWWFHVKTLPGAHVVVKSRQGEELPDAVFHRAAALAGWYSQARASEKVEIDYTLKKHLKKPKNGKAGMVIYHKYWSMNIKPGREELHPVKD